MRDKKNIQPINYGINDLMKLKPVSYEWKNSKQNSVKAWSYCTGSDEQ